VTKQTATCQTHVSLLLFTVLMRSELIDLQMFTSRSRHGPAAHTHTQPLRFPLSCSYDAATRSRSI